MISYYPLAMTLKKKSMTSGDLARLLGLSLNGLRTCLNGHDYIKTSTLENICHVLHCKINDVISWETGDQNKIKRIPVGTMNIIDWDKLCNLINISEWSLVRLSRELGRQDNYLQKAKGNKSKLKPEVVERLELLLGCRKGEFLSASPKE